MATSPNENGNPFAALAAGAFTNSMMLPWLHTKRKRKEYTRRKTDLSLTKQIEDLLLQQQKKKTQRGLFLRVFFRQRRRAPDPGAGRAKHPRGPGVPLHRGLSRWALRPFLCRRLFVLPEVYVFAASERRQQRRRRRRSQRTRVPRRVRGDAGVHGQAPGGVHRLCEIERGSRSGRRRRG